MAIFPHTLYADEIKMWEARMYGSWEQDKNGENYPRIQWKIGEGGTVYFWTGTLTYRVAGHYEVNYKSIVLFADSGYLFRFGVVERGVSYYDDWKTFKTLGPIVETKHETENIYTQARLNGYWAIKGSGSLLQSFHWKKGIDGTEYGYNYPLAYRTTGEYNESYLLKNLVLKSRYYFRFGLYIERAKMYWYWGEWLTFHTGINEMHFRAYGKDPKGKVIYGDDMSFEY